MAKNVTTDNTSQRPTMGNSAATLGKAAKPVKGKLVKKTAQSKGFLEAATAKHRPNIQESMGASLHPTAVLYAANAASAGETQRNTRYVPSAMGNRDFSLRKRYNQGL